MKTLVVCYGEGCGKFLRWIDTPTGGQSDGLCPECYEIEMRKADEYFRDQARAGPATPAPPAPPAE